MKSLLVVLLILMAGFLAYQNRTKQQAIESFRESEQIAETARQVEAAQQKARTEAQARLDADHERAKMQGERDAAIADRDAAIAQRDDARQQAQTLQNEIARLTNSTPKPLTWFQQRQAEGTKINTPPTTAPVRVNPRPYYYYPQ